MKWKPHFRCVVHKRWFGGLVKFARCGVTVLVYCSGASCADFLRHCGPDLIKIRSVLDILKSARSAISARSRYLQVAASVRRACTAGWKAHSTHARTQHAGKQSTVRSASTAAYVYSAGGRLRTVAQNGNGCSNGLRALIALRALFSTTDSINHNHCEYSSQVTRSNK